jgi:hypothetical protein
MSAPLRRVTYVLFGLLWATGCAWLIAHYLFPQQSQFGSLPNPSEPTLMRIHGWCAAAGLFLLGWISSQHILERWSQFRRRPSGPVLASLALLLVVSGYALYYTTDRLHDLAALAHEVVGGAAILAGSAHWIRARGARGL